MELFKAHTGGTVFLGGEEEAKAVENYAIEAEPSIVKREIQMLVARRRLLRQSISDSGLELKNVNERLDKLLSELNLKGS